MTTQGEPMDAWAAAAAQLREDAAAAAAGQEEAAGAPISPTVSVHDPDENVYLNHNTGVEMNADGDTVGGAAASSGGLPRAPIATSTIATADLLKIIHDMQLEMTKMREQLAEKVSEKKTDKDDKNKLKSIDIRNLEKPEPYDNVISKFDKWYERLSHLMVNSNQTWKYVLKATATMGRTRIVSTVDTRGS